MVDKSGKAYAKELVFTVVLTLVMIGIQKSVRQPDFGRTLGMRISGGVITLARKQGQMWEAVGNKALEAYDGFRP